ncbi:MAG TPA: hypothetical protein VH165_36765, partial [Kofleriaceae bacterium]|nr:hypothetical protein [Kofleriaceae bacterium]
REAARWTGAFPQLIAPAHRRFAAYDLEGGLAIIDGWPWASDGAIDPCARPIALATRRPVTALAIAAILPADAGVPALIVGPIACGASDAELDGFAAELARLAELLPGPAPAAICALAEREAAILAAAPRVAATADVLARWAQLV